MPMEQMAALLHDGRPHVRPIDGSMIGDGQGVAGGARKLDSASRAECSH